jgi:transcriptional regulator with XRE-family HTH domain
VLREQREMTQEEVAAAAQLDSKHIQDMEHGRTNPTIASLAGVANAYGLSLSQLLEDV